MKIWSAILTGISELMAHKLRSLLTMLGVIFGIASVIAMVSIGAGARQEALEQIRLLGVDVVHINRKSLTGDLALKAQQDSPQGLTYGDALALKKFYSSAQRVVPVCRVFGEVRARGQGVPSKVFGTTADYPIVARLDITEGRFIDEHDVESRAHVCVIGSEIKRTAFFLENATGRTLKIGNQEFVVIGVMEERSLAGGRKVVSLRDINEDIYIPITAAMDEFQIYVEQAIPSDYRTFRQLLARLRERPPLEKRPITQIILQVGDQRETWEAARVASRMLEQRHKGIVDYEVAIPAELLRQSQQTQRIFNIVMGAIASISLVVGGIGIMNIMLATVSARAREIGIRRCVGASRADIARQFLLECLVITSIGGLLGIALGVEMARLISGYAKWRTIVSGQAILLSLIVAMTTGIVFGLYPAVRAAKIEPMEALRAE
ncbi:MAG: FtsX-like permease family protein [Armatimonadetes bacterium]|nr:FtsX-like permease family protein [Armatimonadota bacterium]NIM24588.1 FtsX-like permease family protein [Armatimonadota bacterium]NIM68464.1 FtsX-like permease family protein [Armatimonadota bacterium]NIM76850.1 FtsX-like permease family protein [Armatimonadota bacterium]NIN06661.1 FtsX-like permease family protein [Armatimonadota bacterium]